MSVPLSQFIAKTPRLHYLQWNCDGDRPVVLLHGNTANAWWWQWLASAMPVRYRLIALDQRGHGDSEWVRPPAYQPDDYVLDLENFLNHCNLDRPLLVGHSMGGLNTIAFAARFPLMLRGAVAIDTAITSSSRRDRFLRRLRSLPEVVYPDLETAITRFRLMPSEGDISDRVLAAIAERSLTRTAHGWYTLKFDRESFTGSDGLNVCAAIAKLQLPLLLLRGEMSRIMTAEAARTALISNPRVQLEVIRGAHHHLPLERPDLLAQAIDVFASTLFE